MSSHQASPDIVTLALGKTGYPEAADSTIQKSTRLMTEDVENCSQTFFQAVVLDSSALKTSSLDQNLTIELACKNVKIIRSTIQNMIRKTGRKGIGLVSELGELTWFGASSVTSLFGQRHISEKLFRAIYEIGVRCLPITLIVGLFMGLILGLQLYYVLSNFSSESLLGQVVALSLIMEIGPVFTAIMIVGQAGSAMCAEIGIQRNAEQIDALHTMRVNPLGFLVSPRLYAALIAFPILTAFFDIVGILGGHLTGVEMLGVDSGAYWNRIHEGVSLKNVMDGFIKALTFGLLTTIICTFQGYFTHIKASVPGARGVSQSTTRAVVLSSIAILASDYLITSFRL